MCIFVYISIIMMEINEFKSFVKAEIKKQAFKQVDDDTPLLSGGILDSITAVDLAVAIEEKTGKQIPFQEISEENFDSVNKIAAYLGL